AVDILITATFTKDMDPSTITPASFTISDGVTGTVTYANKIATFTPDIPLDYDTSYMVTITTAVTDTFGNNLAGNHIWSFSTPSLIPQATIFAPSDSVIIGDSVVVRVLTSHPIGVDSVQFFVDGSYSGTGIINGNTTDYSWDASGSIPGSEHIIFAKAFALGNVGFSDTILVFFQWETLMADFNDPWMTDISKVLARSTDSTLELRYEFWEPWFNPYDTIPDDTTLDLGIYFDTDQNQLTGRTDFATIALNDIGAEYRVIIGLHGWDTALAVWNVNVVPSFWDKVYDPSGFVFFDLPANDKVLEFGIRWADLNNTSAINIVSINLFYISTSSFVSDWVPEQDNGHITINRENRYLGKSSVRKSNAKLHPGQNHQRIYINPF
ncbi:MAG: Ig-like domain-containing protein, partial [Candidatus Zixiibacteriota bacterium]